MSWRIPTIPEVFSMTFCMVYGHAWLERNDGVEICTECGAEK